MDTLPGLLDQETFQALKQNWVNTHQFVPAFANQFYTDNDPENGYRGLSYKIDGASLVGVYNHLQNSVRSIPTPVMRTHLVNLQIDDSDKPAFSLIFEINTGEQIPIYLWGMDHYYPNGHPLSNLRITATQKRAYVRGWSRRSKEQLWETMHITSGAIVESYTFDVQDTRDLWNSLKGNLENSIIRLHLGYGEAPGDITPDHPIGFRPVLELLTTLGTDSLVSYWDFSSPCPPNCSGIE